jgi:hypothetical protein
MLGYGSRTCCVRPVDSLRDHEPVQTPPAALLRGCVALLVALTFAAGTALGQPIVPQPPPIAVEEPVDPGFFQVQSAVAQLRDGVYYLNAVVDYRLSTEAIEALHSGVPLAIRLDVEIVDPRRWWFDNDAATLQQSYKVDYHALSERYTVLNVNSGDQASFGSLFAALQYLGRIERLPLIDTPVLDDDRGYYVRMRASLDQEQFPGPLRLLAFWRRDWSIASEWYRWPLRRE